ncbi:BnaC09g11700D [Brassica napus]|uniref:(rape) hypothetical protein n=1 Tax=Brassica napus TaxID=3708 RepID=A0A078GGK1_BRANA|nr:unnamed protein product [Brassica napus]CDY25545.1 BnaC09g11700D [Brassica napus]
MASSSSSSPGTWRYRVFTSFHGPDVRKTFLSHLRKQFNCYGITMFDDQAIERSQIIAPALTQAIRESRISIVVLSKNAMPLLAVDPSDVQKQTGDFGKVFSKTCRRKREEESQRWSEALTDVGNIAGEDFLNWFIALKSTVIENILSCGVLKFSGDFRVGGQLPQIKQNIYPNRYVINQSFTRSPCLALVEIFFLPPPNLRSSLTSHHFSFFLISYLSLVINNWYFPIFYMLNHINNKNIYLKIPAVYTLFNNKYLFISINNLFNSKYYLKKNYAPGKKSFWLRHCSAHLLYELQYVNSDSDHLDHELNEITQIILIYIYCKYKINKLMSQLMFIKDRIVLMKKRVEMNFLYFYILKVLLHLVEIKRILHAVLTISLYFVVSGISFDVSGISELIVSKRAFKRMSNLRFLAIYKSVDDGNDGMHLPVEMEFPRRLRLLQWTSYPNKCLPSTFHPENLVNLCMRYIKLEVLFSGCMCNGWIRWRYLWQGIHPLTNLKKMDLTLSCHLKELPDLSNARNLEKLDLSVCESLVEIPSSFTHLQNLKDLRMGNCINLQVIPPHLNLASLENIDMQRCSKLRNFSIISTNLVKIDISYTEIEDVSALRLFPRLACLSIKKSGEKGLTHLPRTLWYLDLSYTDIESIPDCIKDLYSLHLNLTGCKRLRSLPFARAPWFAQILNCRRL